MRDWSIKKWDCTDQLRFRTLMGYQQPFTGLTVFDLVFISNQTAVSLIGRFEQITWVELSMNREIHEILRIGKSRLKVLIENVDLVVKLMCHLLEWARMAGP